MTQIDAKSATGRDANYSDGHLPLNKYVVIRLIWHVFFKTGITRR